jgi:hypothetical protein
VTSREKEMFLVRYDTSDGWFCRDGSMLGTEHGSSAITSQISSIATKNHWQFDIQ